MKGAPWFKFYPGDFRGGTSEMTPHEVGVYVRLLAIQWEQRSLPKERDRLANMAGGEVSDMVAGKFILCDDGRLRNLRLESHRDEAESTSKARSNAAQNRWKGKANAEQLESNCNAIAYAEVRGQRLEARGHIPEVKDQKEEVRPTPPPPPRTKYPIQVESMPEGLEPLKEDFNSWLRQRGAGSKKATQEAVDMALKALKAWGLDRARHNLSRAIIGAWTGLHDDKDFVPGKKTHGMTREEKAAHDIRILKQRQGES